MVTKEEKLLAEIIDILKAICEKLNEIQRLMVTKG